ncbi:hypothetical protein V1387_14885 [Allomuricauda taeanensis]|uniref:hypothetical protein n=1 Tax=Flagellimonas taeanensis TaxID=1005926 RepID=UPI002E7AFAE0|nr:hypothetical protein [Allomuricauda taeanensis]MEE1963976.1 hypothetical protein [Allomuricauda taeanensis]
MADRFLYVAIHSFYKDKISAIEGNYTESRQKRGTRIKERIAVLEQQAKAIED